MLPTTAILRLFWVHRLAVARTRFLEETLNMAVGFPVTTGQILESHGPIHVNSLSSAGSHLHTCITLQLYYVPSKLSPSVSSREFPENRLTNITLLLIHSGPDLMLPHCQCICSPERCLVIALQWGPSWRTLSCWGGHLSTSPQDRCASHPRCLWLLSPAPSRLTALEAHRFSHMHGQMHSMTVVLAVESVVQLESFPSLTRWWRLVSYSISLSFSVFCKTILTPLEMW